MLTETATAVTTPLKQPLSRPSWWGVMCGAIGCAVGVALICVAFVRTPLGQHVDDALMPEAARGGYYAGTSDAYQAARSVLRLVGNPVHIAIFVAVLVVAGLLARRVVVAVAGVGVLFGSIGAARVLKAEIVRPDFDVIGTSAHNSFPSGHVAAAAGMVFAVALLIRAGHRRWMLLPGVIVCAVVTAATMVAGWHRLSDGLGAVLVAGTLYFVAVAVDRVINQDLADLR